MFKNKKRVINKTTDEYSKVRNKTNMNEEETIMENKNMNNLNDPNHNNKGRKTKTGIAIALLLTGIVIGGTVLVNNGKGQTTVSPQKVGVGEVVAEEFKYKGEDDGSTLYIEEELAKIDREETKKRQEEFNKQLAEDKVEKEQQLEEVQDTEQQVVEVHQEEVQQGEITQQGKGAMKQQETSNTSSNTSSNSGGGQSTQKSTPKQSQPKAQEPKQQEPKQQEPKQQEPKQQEPKQQEPKQQEPKQQEPKQHENINNDENVDPKDVYGHLYEEEHVIPYKTVYVENPLLEEGQENVLLEGVNGTEVHVYDVTILGGGAYQRTLNYKFMSQNPIDRVVEVKQKP